MTNEWPNVVALPGWAAYTKTNIPEQQARRTQVRCPQCGRVMMPASQQYDAPADAPLDWACWTCDPDT